MAGEKVLSYVVQISVDRMEGTSSGNVVKRISEEDISRLLDLDLDDSDEGEEDISDMNGVSPRWDDVEVSDNIDQVRYVVDDNDTVQKLEVNKGG